MGRGQGLARHNDAEARLIRTVTTHAATEDIREILSFYRSPSRLGDEFYNSLSAAVEHLRLWPYTGHRREDLTKRDVCFWYFDPFYLVLHVQPELLTIIAVLHHRRNVARILRKRLRSNPTR